MRLDYMSVAVPSSDGGGLASVRRAAPLVRPRPANRTPGPAGQNLLVDGLLDTGADKSAVPIWLLEELGTPIDKRTRRKVYSASGPFWAYTAKLGMEIQCNGQWFDIGVSDVLVPDTPWSLDPLLRRPILLGLKGFFNKARMYIDHTREEFWLEPPTG